MNLSMVRRSLKQDATLPNVFVVASAQQLLDAVSSQASHIEVRDHLDLRAVQPLGNGTMLFASDAGPGQVIWVCIGCTVTFGLILTEAFLCHNFKCSDKLESVLADAIKHCPVWMVCSSIKNGSTHKRICIWHTL